MCEFILKFKNLQLFNFILLIRFVNHTSKNDKKIWVKYWQSLENIANQIKIYMK